MRNKILIFLLALASTIMLYCMLLGISDIQKARNRDMKKHTTRREEIKKQCLLDCWGSYACADKCFDFKTK